MEFERSQALARLRATEALLEQVQKKQQVCRATQQVVPTTELFRTFAKVVAAAVVPEGFEIDEVEVRGALGTRTNEVVMGLNATKLSGVQSAICYALHPAPRGNWQKAGVTAPIHVQGG